ncbi:MAG TPA: FHA domain-containing protein [Candidatus Baltobacteraceae bacterium]
MNFAAVMRVGSLEIVGALVVFGIIAQRLPRGAGRAAPEALSVRLAVREGALRAPVREVALEVAEGEPVLVGRSSGAAVDLKDPEVSRRHARLELARGVLYISDLGSSNGTFLNGKPLGDGGIELRVGDDIDVGNTRITVTSTVPVP